MELDKEWEECKHIPTAVPEIKYRIKEVDSLIAVFENENAKFVPF